MDTLAKMDRRISRTYINSVYIATAVDSALSRELGLSLDRRDLRFTGSNCQGFLTVENFRDEIKLK